MLKRLNEMPPTSPLFFEVFSELRARGFEGDLSVTYAERVVQATDNSIYQVLPQAVAFPRTTEDLARIARLTCDPRFADVALAARGGGTGTNGQSLTDGLVVDVSRHMNRILEINAEARWVRVQSGVVKDQLNAAIAPLGLFFPPELSTSDRATIGGMVSTDACGQGSCLYGKTRDHVLELTTVLLDGTIWRSGPLTAEQLAAAQRRPDRVGAIHRRVDAIHREQADLIAASFPKLNRCLTGYDLAHIRDVHGRFDLNAILCGSEGTLGLLADAKLNLVPIPPCRALAMVRYGSFDAALRDARALIEFGASSIETIDSTVLALARGDSIWEDVRPFVPDDDGAPALGVNIVEFVGSTQQLVEGQLRAITAALTADSRSLGRRGFTVARGEHEVGRIWEMRKRAVGLLGNMQGDKRPIAFVEDTAVPPEHLADYIAEFRAALDARGLSYGMFGHVDAGVLHVRPAIDMKDPRQEGLIREITEEVVRITRKYHGLLWGEHGKGVRSEFSPTFFGPLYPALQSIKSVFDPRNQLNPGKIAAPLGAALLRIDELTTRGQLDRTIAPQVRAGYDEALHCNGNGACFNWDPDDAMCPSYKATRERRHSPKGRAALIREWLRQLAALGCDPLAEADALRQTGIWRSLPGRIRNTWSMRRGEPDFSHEVKAAMDGCLACKSCVGQCPIKVDVPTFRAKFLELYYGRYLRPARHYIVCAIEHIVPLLAFAPGLHNALIDSRIGRAGLRSVGLVQLPALSRNGLRSGLRARGIPVASPAALQALSLAERTKSLVVVQDAFTSHYEAELLLDLFDLLLLLGVRPWIAPYRPNGKPLHVHGFLGAFRRVAAGNATMLGRLAATGVELVGVDPSMTLTYRCEYASTLGEEAGPPVMLIQEWLAQHLERLPALAHGREYLLLPHCTERTGAPESLRHWQEVFDALGASLRVLPSGCCGMAGTYGHESEHRATSERIYALSWSKYVDAGPARRDLLATGHSCRSQVVLIDGVNLLHPVQALLGHLREHMRELSSPVARGGQVGDLPLSVAEVVG